MPETTTRLLRMLLEACDDVIPPREHGPPPHVAWASVQVQRGAVEEFHSRIDFVRNSFGAMEGPTDTEILDFLGRPDVIIAANSPRHSNYIVATGADTLEPVVHKGRTLREAAIAAMKALAASPGPQEPDQAQNAHPHQGNA